VKIKILWHSLTLHLYYSLRKTIDRYRFSLDNLNNKTHEIIRSIGNTELVRNTCSFWDIFSLFLYYYLRSLFDFSWISAWNIKIATQKIISLESFYSTLVYVLLLAYMVSQVLAVMLLTNKVVDLYLSNFDIFQLSINLQEAIRLVMWCVTTAFCAGYLRIIRIFSHDYTLVCGGTAKRHHVSYDRVRQSAANTLFATDEDRDKIY
jgi:hypothetical protein